jgi:hypothetical protein
MISPDYELEEKLQEARDQERIEVLREIDSCVTSHKRRKTKGNGYMIDIGFLVQEVRDLNKFLPVSVYVTRK